MDCFTLERVFGACVNLPSLSFFQKMFFKTFSKAILQLWIHRCCVHSRLIHLGTGIKLRWDGCSPVLKQVVLCDGAGGTYIYHSTGSPIYTSNGATFLCWQQLHKLSLFSLHSHSESFRLKWGPFLNSLFLCVLFSIAVLQNKSHFDKVENVVVKR